MEDSLYLREYAKVFAWGMTKAKDMQTIRTYYSLLSFVNESEDAARLHYLKHFGLTDEGIQSLPLRPENRAYVDSMIEAAKNGEGAAECMMACLPCMLSYGWIFQKLLKKSLPCRIPFMVHWWWTMLTRAMRRPAATGLRLQKKSAKA